MFTFNRPEIFFAGLLFISILIASLSAPNSFAQEMDSEASEPATQEAVEGELTEAEAALVQAAEESRDIFANEMFPIQYEASSASARIWAQINGQRELIQRLESERTSLPGVRREIDQLVERLEVLKKVEDVLSDMNPEAKNEALVQAKENREEFERERQAISGPLTEDLTTLNRLYSNNNGPFAERFNIVFPDKATKPFEGFVRTHLNSNYAAAQVSARFDRGKEKVTLSLVMSGTQQYELMLKQERIQAYGKFNDKYPIINQSDRNLMFLVNDIQITVHLTNGKMNPEELRAFVDSAIDFETLEKTLGKLKRLRLEKD